MKKVLIGMLLLILSAALNFGVFLLSYKKLAFPYLHEAQRMDNAPFIFSYVLASFLFCSAISIVLTYVLSKKIA